VGILREKGNDSAKGQSRDRCALPDVFGNRIKTNPAYTGICQHDAYIGWTIISCTEHNVECAQGKTSTNILGIEVVKDVANARTS
jgi:hypothetical protein